MKLLFIYVFFFHLAKRIDFFIYTYLHEMALPLCETGRPPQILLASSSRAVTTAGFVRSEDHKQLRHAFFIQSDYETKTVHLARHDLMTASDCVLFAKQQLPLIALKRVIQSGLAVAIQCASSGQVYIATETQDTVIPVPTFPVQANSFKRVGITCMYPLSPKQGKPCFVVFGNDLSEGPCYVWLNVREIAYGPLEAYHPLHLISCTHKAWVPVDVVASDWNDGSNQPWRAALLLDAPAAERRSMRLLVLRQNSRGLHHSALHELTYSCEIELAHLIVPRSVWYISLLRDWGGYVSIAMHHAHGTVVVKLPANAFQVHLQDNAVLNYNNVRQAGGKVYHIHHTVGMLPCRWQCITDDMFVCSEDDKQGFVTVRFLFMLNEAVDMIEVRYTGAPFVMCSPFLVYYPLTGQVVTLQWHVANMRATNSPIVYIGHKQYDDGLLRPTLAVADRQQHVWQLLILRVNNALGVN